MTRSWWTLDRPLVCLHSRQTYCQPRVGEQTAAHTEVSRKDKEKVFLSSVQCSSSSMEVWTLLTVLIVALVLVSVARSGELTPLSECSALFTCQGETEMMQASVKAWLMNLFNHNIQIRQTAHLRSWSIPPKARWGYFFWNTEEWWDIRLVCLITAQWFYLKLLSSYVSALTESHKLASRTTQDLGSRTQA